MNTSAFLFGGWGLVGGGIPRSVLTPLSCRRRASAATAATVHHATTTSSAVEAGVELRLQYPSCPRCQHNFFDGPPGNGTADELNAEDVRAYMQVCQQVGAWKKDKENHEQP